MIKFKRTLSNKYPTGEALHDELKHLYLEVRRELSTQANRTKTIETGYLLHLLNDGDKRLCARYILERAETIPFPPLGATSTAILDKIEAIIGGQADALNGIEAFILLVSVCSPHLLYLYDKYNEEPINEGHVRQLAEQLSQEVSAPSNIGNLLKRLAFEVSIVANARIKFDLEDSQYSPSGLDGSLINLRLLGSLLHLANFINLNQFVDPQPPSYLSHAGWLERYRWWRQAYVRDVSIKSQWLQLYIRLPKGYKDEYEPILVDPLDEEIHNLIRTYAPILFQAGISLNLLSADVTVGEGIPIIPPDEWQHLKQEVWAEQARKSKDRLHQDVLLMQRRWDSLVKADISQAEQMIAEEHHLEGAEAFARAAALLARTGQAYQARNYATQAAEYYLKGGNQLAAAQQYLQAAEVWLSHQTTPELATYQLEQAGKIAAEIKDPALQVQVLHLQAWLAFATLRDPDAPRFWEQIKGLIPQIADESQRLELWRTSALQQATLVMVWEEWDTAHEILETALAACPETALDERLDLLQGLLLFSSERGDWETTDRVYHEAQKLLKPGMDPRRSGLLTMHYGASLARRGALQEAYETYSSAIQQLDGQADTYTLRLAYQNMQYMLLRNGSTFFSGFAQHEARRVDLVYSTQTQDRGYAHTSQALLELSTGNHRGAMQHIRLALAYYWPEGAWAGIERCYRMLAKLHAAIDEKSVDALQAAIRAGDLEAVEQYARPLRDISDVQQLTEIIDKLISVRPAACEQQVAVKALGVLADVIPPTLLSPTLDHLLLLLQGPEENDRHVTLRRNSAEALRNLIAQLTFEQVSKVIHVVLDQLQRQQRWTVTEALLKLLDECFVQKQLQVEQSLYAPVLEALLNFKDREHLRDSAERVLVHMARSAPTDVRKKVIAYLKNQPDQFDNLVSLAFLKEPISEEQLSKAIEQILRAINPQPVSTGEGTLFGIGGTSPRALNHFNEMLPPSLYNRVIDGLLEAIINDNNDLSTRSSAIWALSDLPTEVLVGRADEVAEYLMWGADGTLPRSSFINLELESQTDPFSMVRINTGNIAQVRRSSLRALGRLYIHLNTNNQKQASTQLITASRDPDPIIRQGVAMALRAIEGSMIQQQRLLLALVALLHDPDPETCAWACTASGNLISRGLTEPFTEDLIEQLISLAETSTLTEARVGAAIGLRMAAWSGQLNEAIHQQVLAVLERLANDVSFRVRREAAAQKT